MIIILYVRGVRSHRRAANLHRVHTHTHTHTHISKHKREYYVHAGTQRTSHHMSVCAKRSSKLKRDAQRLKYIY